MTKYYWFPNRIELVLVLLLLLIKMHYIIIGIMHLFPFGEFQQMPITTIMQMNLKVLAARSNKTTDI